MTKKLFIGFAGLTHLGIVSAVAAVSKGFQVIGYHKSKILTENLSNNILPVSEPGLQKILKNLNKNRIYK